MSCKWNGTGNPRVLPGRHIEIACETCDDDCAGCLPCEEDHCIVCRRTHALVCAECLAVVRDDLAQILTLCDALPEEAEHRGVNGEAMMLLGPSADPEAWRNRAMSAIQGRLDARYLDDCRDEQHPLWVLGTWEQVYRDHLDQPSDLQQTIARAGAYLNRQLHKLAEVEEIPFDDFARDVRGCRAHLEDVLRDGEQVEKGAPCPACGEGALVKEYGKSESADRWACQRRGCRQWWTEADYREKVAAVYERHADALTASAIRRVYRVPEGSVRAWASEKVGKVRKRGKDANGLQLYDVADVLALRDGDKVAG